MKLAYLEDADQSHVARVVRDVVEARGGIVTDHAPSHTTFEGVDTDASSFSKGGYVGTYQHVGEREVELRIHARATVPAKVFWRTVFLEVPAAILLFALDPHPNVWVLATAVMYAALILTFLIYLGTWRSSANLERDLLDDFVRALRERAGAERVLTEEERAMEAFEEELRAEVAEARLKQKRKGPAAAKRPAPGVRVAGIAETLRALLPSRRRKPSNRKKASGDGGDGAAAASKRARIERLRRELEQRRAEGDE